MARRSPKKSNRRLMSDEELADALAHFEIKRAREEALYLLSLVKPTGAAVAHLVAEEFNRTGDLKASKHWICRAAELGAKEFFIDLGKLLEGKRLKPNTWSKLDQDIACILCLSPTIRSTNAVKALRNWGHPSMSPLAFKQLRYNWKRAAVKTRQRWKEAGHSFSIHISFLDGEEP